MKFPSFGFGRRKKEADDEAFDDEGPLEDEADEIDDAAQSRSARAQAGGRAKQKEGPAPDAGAAAADEMADDVAARILASLPQVGDDLSDEKPAGRPAAPASADEGADPDADRSSGDDGQADTQGDMPDDAEPAGAGGDDPVFDDDAGDDGDADEDADGEGGGKRRLIVLAAAATVAVAALGSGAWWWLGVEGGGAPRASFASSGPRVEIMLPPPPGAPGGGLNPPPAGMAETAAQPSLPTTRMAARGQSGDPAGGDPTGGGPAVPDTMASGAPDAEAPGASGAAGASASPAAALPAGIVADAAGAAQPGASLNTLAATLQGPGAGLVVPPVNVALLQALPDAPPGNPLPPAPEAGLFEPGPGGPLPKVDGRRMPWQVYARPALAAAGPRVAIVMGGLGLSGFVTRQTVEAMPPDVTIALDAYGRDVAALGLMARARGHETLVVAPLEANDFPFSDPGPLGWQVGQAPEENVRRLQTVLSRFAGYAGVQLDLASRVADQSGGLRPIAQILKTRGLMVFHPGGPPGAGAVALRELRLPMASADVVIDDQPTDAAIAQRLADLEARARANPGGAVGFARPYPATLLRLSPWLGTLAAKGITLVPLTALIRDGSS